MAKEFVMFSFLLPCHRLATPPNLAAVLQIDIAEPTTVKGGIIHIRLGEVKQRSDGGSTMVQCG